MENNQENVELLSDDKMKKPSFFKRAFRTIFNIATLGIFDFWPKLLSKKSNGKISDESQNELTNASVEKVSAKELETEQIVKSMFNNSDLELNNNNEINKENNQQKNENNKVDQLPQQEGKEM